MDSYMICYKFHIHHILPYGFVVQIDFRMSLNIFYRDAYRFYWFNKS